MKNINNSTMKKVIFESQFPHEVDFKRAPTYFLDGFLKLCLILGIESAQKFIEESNDFSISSVQNRKPLLNFISEVKTKKDSYKVGDSIAPEQNGKVVGPSLRVCSLQDISFNWKDGNNGMVSLDVIVDKKKYGDAKIISGMVSWCDDKIKELAFNSGFTDVRKFLYFYRNIKKAQIVHLGKPSDDLSTE